MLIRASQGYREQSGRAPWQEFESRAFKSHLYVNSDFEKV